MMEAKEIRRHADAEGNASLVVFHAGGGAEDRETTAKLVGLAGFVALCTGDLDAGRMFQTDGPLYAVKLDEDRARQAPADAGVDS